MFFDSENPNICFDILEKLVLILAFKANVSSVILLYFWIMEITSFCILLLIISHKSLLASYSIKWCLFSSLLALHLGQTNSLYRFGFRYSKIVPIGRSLANSLTINIKCQYFLTEIQLNPLYCYPVND
ncbi:hypothetical protein RhiirC2_796550 [Rhizophagus irregularis]|uniref:Uncharacterized protein n=1 Tax=Rhizophagus irregularis TaxID=588596 RepID=A0A2N1M9J1_9GLOM|nr:hypothetical protein RhiirC2_796550 [Rhizophagus irregularis]